MLPRICVTMSRRQQQAVVKRTKRSDNVVTPMTIHHIDYSWIFLFGGALLLEGFPSSFVIEYYGRLDCNVPHYTRHVVLRLKKCPIPENISAVDPREIPIA